MTTIHTEGLSEENDDVRQYGMFKGGFIARQVMLVVGQSYAEWFDYIQSTLDILNRTSIQGFSFNYLTAYLDEEKNGATFITPILVNYL